MLFGLFIDKSCDLWEKTCSGTGNCLQYNNIKLSYMLFGATCLFQGRSFTSLMALSSLYCNDLFLLLHFSIFFLKTVRLRGIISFSLTVIVTNNHRLAIQRKGSLIRIIIKILLFLSHLVLSAVFYLLSWKLYKPLPNSEKLLGDPKQEDEDGRNSVTVSNITEGTVVEDMDNNSYFPNAISMVQSGLVNSKPVFIYESAI